MIDIVPLEAVDLSNVWFDKIGLHPFIWFWLFYQLLYKLAPIWMISDWLGCQFFLSHPPSLFHLVVEMAVSYNQWLLERKLLMENDPLWPKWVVQSSRNGYAGSHLYCQCSLGHKLSPILKKIPLPLPMVSFRFCARLPEVNIDEVYCMYYYECCFIIGQGPI